MNLNWFGILNTDVCPDHLMIEKKILSLREAQDALRDSIRETGEWKQADTGDHFVWKINN